MIKICSYYINKYVLIVNGDNGEKQLVIVSSADGGYTRSAVVSAQRSEVIVTVIHSMEYTTDFSEFIRKYLREWVESDTPPTPAEREIEYEYIEGIIAWHENERT